jgi:hypothetical protein
MKKRLLIFLFMSMALSGGRLVGMKKCEVGGKKVSSLPCEDTLIVIFGFLTQKHFLKIREVSKEFRSIASITPRWIKACYNSIEDSAQFIAALRGYCRIYGQVGSRLRFDVRMSNISDDDLKGFEGFTNLKKLDLYWTDITGVCFKFLPESLKELGVFSCKKLEEKHLEALKTKRKNLKIWL